jgi:hypothetical protein
VALSLASDRWTTLQASCGNASGIPQLLRRFAHQPDLDAFESLRSRLTGDGDIVATTAFYAALPHIIEGVRGADQTTREQVLSHIGWGAALAAAKEPPGDLKLDYERALVEMQQLSSATLVSCEDGNIRRFLLAAIAAGIRDPEAALALIHLNDAILCPRCGEVASCRSCGLPLELAVPIRGE